MRFNMIMMLILLLGMRVFSSATIHPDNPLIEVDGALFITADTNRMVMDRYSQEVLDSAMLGTVNLIAPYVAATQAGMVLRFRTASPVIAVAFEQRQGGFYQNPYFDVYCDGVFKNHATSGLTFFISASAPGAHSWEIMLPHLYSVNFQGLELDSGYALENDSILQRPVYVAIGNSITHGMGQTYSNTTYPVSLARKKNWKLYNLAVGGSKIAEAVSMLVRDRDVDVFTIMWGFNDFTAQFLSTYDTTQSIHGRLASLIADLRVHHPLAAIYVVTPSFTTRWGGLNALTGLTIDDYRKATRNIIDSMQQSGDTLLFKLEGTDFSDINSLTDEVHFTPAGAVRFADSLEKYVLERWNVPACDTVLPAAPVIFQSIALDARQVALSWNSIEAGNPRNAIVYHVYRDSMPFLSTSDTVLIDDGVDFSVVPSYRYSISAVRQALGQCHIEGLMSDEVLVTTPPPDSVPLRIKQVYGVNGTSVLIAFNKTVDSVSAVNSANYSITGLTVSSVSLSKSRDLVTLIVSPMALNESYQMIAGNIQDRSLPVHTLPSGTAADFICSDLNNNLHSWWPLDEKTESLVLDWSGNNNDGGCFYGFSRTPGMLENALHFTPGAYAQMASGLHGLHFPFTIALWINREDDLTRAILSTEDVSGSYYGAWMGISASGQVQINFGNGGSPGPGSRKTKVSANTVVKNVWTHVAAVVNSATDMTLYIDGVDAGGTYSGTATSMAHSVAGRMQVGYQTSAITPILYYHGGMDDIRVYDTTLTQEQVGTLVTAPTMALARNKTERMVFSLAVTPNPFNPSAVITFSIPVSQKVVLDVFDVKGSRVARLLDGKKEAGGHKLIWAGSSQASGIYMLRMQAGTKILERKLVYLK